MTQMGSTSGYSISTEVQSAVLKYTQGLPGGINQVWERPGYIYHRVNMPVAGTSQLNFFNESRQPGVTNLDQQSTLPGNYAFVLGSIAIDFLYGIDRDGNRMDGDRSRLSLGGVSAAADDVLDRQHEAQEYIREVMCQGEFTFKVAQRPVIDQHYGLVNFPAGGGQVVTGAGSSSATVANAGATDLIAANSNGAPLFANRFTLANPYPIISGQQFQGEINWQRLIDATATGYPYNGSTAAYSGTIMVTLGGIMISPGSA